VIFPCGRTISLDELINGLAMSGFMFNRADIQKVFNYVDLDRSGALDFSEVAISIDSAAIRICEFS
jgi:Ca2+-binding EF-hand superfamily protein